MEVNLVENEILVLKQIESRAITKTWATYMINNLVGYTAVVLEDVEIGSTGCGRDLLSDGLFLIASVSI